jgi:Uma2 family endonuclease
MAATVIKMTLADFLEYDDGSEQRYEVESGELVLMPAESDLNQYIASFLFAAFLGLGIPSRRLRIGLELAVSSAYAGVRLPDLVVLSPDGMAALAGATRSIVLPEMPAPLLVVEVVSPGQEKRDYRYKRSEYGARGIAEYWIVDPLLLQVTVLEWVEGLYEERVFKEKDRILSPSFPTLSLTVQQVLNG